MRRYLILLLLFPLTGKAQQLVWDPLVMSTLVVQHTEQQEKLKEIRSNESRILTAQIYISEKMEQIREINEKMHSRLTTVTSIIKDTKELRYAAQIAADIARYQERMLQLAASNPTLLLVAYQAEKALVDRTANLMIYMYSALVGGEVNMLDNRQRQQILEHVIEELRLMRGMAYGVQRKMRFAARVGVFTALNPFTVPFPDQDAALVSEVLSEFK